MLARMLPQANRFGDVNDAQPPAGQNFHDFVKKAELGDFVLYRITQDPAETRERSKDDPRRFDALKARMVDLHREIRAEGPVWPKAAKLERSAGSRRRR